MEVTSLNFAVLVFFSIFIFYLLNQKYRIGFLTILSCGFIATFHLYSLLHILVYTLINYYLGLKIPVSKYKKTLFRTGIIINLSQIFLFRYASFSVDPILQVFNSNL